MKICGLLKQKYYDLISFIKRWIWRLNHFIENYQFLYERVEQKKSCFSFRSFTFRELLYCWRPGFGFLWKEKSSTITKCDRKLFFKVLFSKNLIFHNPFFFNSNVWANGTNYVYLYLKFLIFIIHWTNFFLEFKAID